MTAWDRKDKRTEVVAVKVGRAVKLQLHVLAGARGVPASVWLREALEEKLARESAALGEGNCD